MKGMDFGMEYILETKQLTKVYDERAVVDKVDLHIEKGDIYGLIGRNGAGKTTIMRMVLSLAFPTEGEIYLFGNRTNGISDKRLGSLIEAPGLYKNYTAVQNMQTFCTLYGEDFSKINPILEYVGLAETGDLKAGKFSLGMKQRLGIAIAMLGDPELIILDEPVNGLDPAGIKDVRDLILKLNREKGVTFMISSHLLDELSKMVNKYGILNEGCLVEEITSDELARKFHHRLIITVDQVQKAMELISAIVPAENITYYENQVFVVFDNIDSVSPEEMGGRINKLLIENGIMVNNIQNQSDGIEQYFLERIGG